MKAVQYTWTHIKLVLVEARLQRTHDGVLGERAAQVDEVLDVRGGAGEGARRRAARRALRRTAGAPSCLCAAPQFAGFKPTGFRSDDQGDCLGRQKQARHVPGGGGGAAGAGGAGCGSSGGAGCGGAGCCGGGCGARGGTAGCGVPGLPAPPAAPALAPTCR